MYTHLRNFNARVKHFYGNVITRTLNNLLIKFTMHRHLMLRRAKQKYSDEC